MFFSFDRYKRIERPQLVLCEISKKRLGTIDDIGLTMEIRYNNVSEVRFMVPSIMDDSRASFLFDEIKELRLVYIKDFGYFQITDISERSDGYRFVKECTALSAENMLRQKNVMNLEGEYRLFDPLKPYESLLGLLLLKIPGWKIGNVDGALLTRWRTMKVTQQDLYTLLTKDIAEAYECIFVFNYDMFVIDVLDITRQFQKTGIYLSYENLIKGSAVKPIVDKVVTALSVEGGGGIDISGVNPNGTNMIYNVDYFKDRMTPGLLAALTAYEKKYASQKPAYASLLLQLKNKNKELQLLNSNPPQYEVTFSSTADGTAQIVPTLDGNSGLSQLQAVLNALEGIRAVRIEKGNIPYTDVNARMAQLNPVITAKKAAIAAKAKEIDGVAAQLRGIVDQLKMEGNFTDEQWVELNGYFIYDTFQDNTFIWTDLMTQGQKQDVQQELYEYGARALERACYPRYTFEIDAVNFIALPEFAYFTEQFKLGTTFTLDLGHYKVNPILLGVKFNFDDLSDFKLVYGNKSKLDESFSFLDFAGDSIGTSHTVSFDLVKLEAMKRQSDDVAEFINGALDASRNELVSSATETAIEISKHGLRARSFDWDTKKATGDELWLTGRQIALSDNGFTSSRLAIGRVAFPGKSGGSGYGVVGDLLVGRIVAGNSLFISNDKNNFRLDDTGAWLENANFTITKTQSGVTNKIVLDPTEGISVYKGNDKQIYLGTDGNVYFKGQINGGTINISGNFLVDDKGNVTIKAGSIALGGTAGAPNFAVDSQGNVTIKQGSISIGGTAASPNFAVDSVGNVTIKRGSININNGKFSVDSAGKVTMSDAHITGGSFTLGNTVITAASFKSTNMTGCDMDNSCVYRGTGANIVANSINAKSITAGTITANEIAANAITSEKIYAGAITANKIATGAISAQMISAGTLSAGVVYAGAINASQITAGSISADRISGGTLSGVTIYGGTYYGTQGRGSITIGGGSTWGDFRLYGSGSSPVFAVSDFGSTTQVSASGNPFLSVGSRDVYAMSSWTFTSAPYVNGKRILTTDDLALLTSNPGIGI